MPSTPASTDQSFIRGIRSPMIPEDLFVLFRLVEAAAIVLARWADAVDDEAGAFASITEELTVERVDGGRGGVGEGRWVGAVLGYVLEDGAGRAGDVGFRGDYYAFCAVGTAVRI